MSYSFDYVNVDIIYDESLDSVICYGEDDINQFIIKTNHELIKQNKKLKVFVHYLNFNKYNIDEKLKMNYAYHVYKNIEKNNPNFVIILGDNGFEYIGIKYLLPNEYKIIFTKNIIDSNIYLEKYNLYKYLNKNLYILNMQLKFNQLINFFECSFGLNFKKKNFFILNNQFNKYNTYIIENVFNKVFNIYKIQYNIININDTSDLKFFIETYNTKNDIIVISLLSMIRDEVTLKFLLLDDITKLINYYKFKHIFTNFNRFKLDEIIDINFYYNLYFIGDQTATYFLSILNNDNTSKLINIEDIYIVINSKKIYYNNFEHNCISKFNIGVN